MSADATGDYPKPGLCHRTLLFAVVGVLSFAPIGLAADTATSKLVVFLFPQNDDGSPGHVVADQGIRSAFASGSAEPIELYAEFLDVSRPRVEGDRDVQLEYLRRKYQGRKVDLVITGLSSALDFALAHRTEVFPGVPIVFCAVDHREVLARKLPPDVVGAPIIMDLTATLDVALRLHPKTQRLCVVAGQSSMDAAWVAHARRDFQKYESRLEIDYLTGLPLEDLLRRVANLPEQTLIYYVHMFQDGTGKVLSPAHVLQQLAQTANAPIYGHVDTYVGRGIVGGRVFSFETAVKDAAGISLRILAGEKPENIGVLDTSESTYLFDGHQLKRWGISEDNLPPGSVVRNKESGFWDLYKWPVIGVASLCIIEALLISGLLVQRMNRRRADARFRQVVEAAPNGIVMVGRDGTIVLANAQMAKLFGFRKEEMLGQPVEMLLPERLREQHPTYRADFFAVPEVRSMGAGRELFGRCKDGTEVPVEIGLSPMRTGDGLFVLASIIDVTERRRAEGELRESQRELRDLTGKLLIAQETERRRIARDLHDDLNQSLALLAVELDLMSQNPAQSATQTAGQLREMSTRVKDLSSSVHDLSHQLHPSKLGQLGLVTAMRSLCRELAQGHGLPIEFTHSEVPETIPEDTALCLYRIAQEALRNAIKHSHARHAKVAVSGNGNAIYLQIADDGAGFDPESADRCGGLGLVSMRERLHLVDGVFTIESQPSCGTRIDVRVPLPSHSLQPVTKRQNDRP